MHETTIIDRTEWTTKYFSNRAENSKFTIWCKQQFFVLKSQ